MVVNARELEKAQWMDQKVLEVEPSSFVPGHAPSPFLKGKSVICRNRWYHLVVSCSSFYTYHLFASHNNPGRQILSLGSSYQWRHWSMRKWSHLPKVSWVVGSNSDIQTYVVRPQSRGCKPLSPHLYQAPTEGWHLAPPQTEQHRLLGNPLESLWTTMPLNCFFI